jgi:formate/nitrite transporter FocA (FNT family)
MITVFAIPAAAFLTIGTVWGYFAIKAMRARRWAVASLRAFATAISFGVVIFKVVLAGNLLR